MGPGRTGFMLLWLWIRHFKFPLSRIKTCLQLRLRLFYLPPQQLSVCTVCTGAANLLSAPLTEVFHSQALAHWVRAALAHGKALTGVSTLFILVKLFGRGEDSSPLRRQSQEVLQRGCLPLLDMRQYRSFCSPHMDHTWLKGLTLWVTPTLTL